MMPGHQWFSGSVVRLFGGSVASGYSGSGASVVQGHKISGRYVRTQVCLSSDSLANTENLQPVARLEVLRFRIAKGLGGRLFRSQATITFVRLWILGVFLDFLVVNA